MHSGFWVNLHHFLYLQARLAERQFVFHGNRARSGAAGRTSRVADRFPGGRYSRLAGCRRVLLKGSGRPRPSAEWRHGNHQQSTVGDGGVPRSGRQNYAVVQIRLAAGSGRSPGTRRARLPRALVGAAGSRQPGMDCPSCANDSENGRRTFRPARGRVPEALAVAAAARGCRVVRRPIRRLHFARPHPRHDFQPRSAQSGRVRI